MPSTPPGCSADVQWFCCAGSSMADPESAVELSIVETPSYALAVVLLFFLTITSVADFVLKNNRRFLERRSSKGLLVSLSKWLGHRHWHTQLSDLDQLETCNATRHHSFWPQSLNMFPCGCKGGWHGQHLYPVATVSR